MYYLLETNYAVKPTAYRTSSLVDDFLFEPPFWLSGETMEEPEERLRVEFWENGGDGLAEILLDSIPLFSKDLVDALKSAGVENLQTYPVTAVLKDGTSVAKEYLATNILGNVKCLDLDKSQDKETARRKLIIDEKKANGKYLFRLAESVSSIIVHKSVKQALETQNFPYLAFKSLS